MNAAFTEALKLDDYDCIVFHDVDMIPENDANMYRCGPHPRHLSPAIDKFDYQPHYGTDFGGVTAITPKQYRKANGHSNQFWGWGGEDNDMEFRIRRKGMKIVPSSLKVGRYKMIPHRASWQFKKSNQVGILNSTREKRADTDGLSDLQYRMVGLKQYQSYTKIQIDLRRIEVKKITLIINGNKAMEMDLDLGSCRWDKYERKHLDISIPVSPDNLEKAINLPEDEELEIALPKPPLESKHKCSKHKKTKSKECEEQELNPKPTKEPEAVIKSLKDAQRICNALHPECRGIVEEVRTGRFLLRHSGVPRNLVLSAPNGGGYHGVAYQKNLPTYIFSNNNVYLKYCPGRIGHIQPYAKPLTVDIVDGKLEGYHMYEFHIDFTVLLKPDKAMYYYGTPYFEAQLREHINVAPFRWYKFGKFLDFDDPETNRNFTFKTSEFNLPNVPGCYSMECKVMGSNHNPYFKWNWWFEIRSNDKYKDAKMREEYFKKKKEEQLQKLSPSLRKDLMAEEQNYKTQREKALNEKRRLFFQQQQLRQASDLMVSRDRKFGKDFDQIKLGASIQLNQAKPNSFHGPMPKEKR